MNKQADRLDLPARTEGDNGELQTDQRRARDHHALDAKPRQKARDRQRIEQAADREAGNDEARDRKAGFAEFEQERRDIGKQPEHAAALDEDRAHNRCAFGLAKMVR